MNDNVFRFMSLTLRFLLQKGASFLGFANMVLGSQNNGQQVLILSAA